MKHLPMYLLFRLILVASVFYLGIHSVSASMKEQFSKVETEGECCCTPESSPCHEDPNPSCGCEKNAVQSVSVVAIAKTEPSISLFPLWIDILFDQFSTNIRIVPLQVTTPPPRQA